jgi:hypothetical protein
MPARYHREWHAGIRRFRELSYFVMQSDPRPSAVLRAAAVALCLAASPLPLQAQSVVYGSVGDSVFHTPLAGALVQLVRDSSSQTRSTLTDSLGDFSFDSVAAGTYLLGFFHPTLDSLGLDLRPRNVRLGIADTAIVNLSIPSARTIAHDICGDVAGDSTTLLLGHVRDAETHRPRSGTITVLWFDLVIARGAIRQERQQYPAKADIAGWYGLCGLPSGVELTASAVTDSAESGVVPVRIPADGILLRDFLVSRVDSTVAVYADSASDSTRTPFATLRRGRARVVGVIRDDKSQPVDRAEVSVPGTGLTTRTTDAGTFDLSGLPAGTQGVEVRALGYEPVRLAVDLHADSTSSITVNLPHKVPVLDIVRIYGKQNDNMAAFLRRAQGGFGHVLTPAAIAQQHALRTSDLFFGMAGVRVVPNARGIGSAVLLRGGCLPLVYYNGSRLQDDAAMDLDAIAPAAEITAIEVYNAPFTPAEYAGNGCGSVVLWVGVQPR